MPSEAVVTRGSFAREGMLAGLMRVWEGFEDAGSRRLRMSRSSKSESRSSMSSSGGSLSLSLSLTSSIRACDIVGVFGGG